MKVLKYFFTLLITIFILSGCSSEKKQQEIIKNIEKLEYNEVVQKYKYNITIPQINTIKSEDISYFNLTMQEHARLIIENLQGITDEVQVSAPYESIINFEVKENNFNILSILLTTYTYEGGAHGNTTLDTYNIDLKNYTLLSFDSFFNENARDYLNMKINDLITKSRENGKKISNTSGEAVIFFENAEVNIDRASMYFQGENIVFVFPLYDLAPYSSGMPIFKFSKKELKAYLR